MYLNDTTNLNIKKLDVSTLVIGVDVAKYKSVARAFTIEGKEIGQAITFGTTFEGFNSFRAWIYEVRSKGNFSNTLVGMEPTGHYWFKIDEFVTESIDAAEAVIVGLSDVKSMRNLTGMKRKKTDHIDAMAIAQTIIFGRFSTPNRRQNAFKDLREVVRFREDKIHELVRLSNKAQGWLDLYFPEYHMVFADWSCLSSIAILQHYATPSEVNNTSEDIIFEKLRLQTKGSVGLKRIRHLKEVASKSISLNKCSEWSRYIFKEYISDYLRLQEQVKFAEEKITELLKRIEYAKNITGIKGLTPLAIASILSETGDLNKYNSPKQLLSYAGLDLKINQSGTRQGKTGISKRGSSRLRCLLFKFLLPVLYHDKTFLTLHKYYTQREKNPLKRMQSMIAIACKFLRTIYGIAKNNTIFDSSLVLKSKHIEFLAA
ncbi:MAG: IS110 family transposase [Bacteroidales bacterium]